MVLEDVCGTNHDLFPVVLSIEKRPDFWSRDPRRALSIQHGKDRRGREATDRVKEILGSKGGYIERGGKKPRSYFRARQYLEHQLRGLSLLNLRVIPARRLRKNFACTSPEATPLLVWGALRHISFPENGRNSL